MRRNPETIRAFLMRTTALYSGVVQAPKPETRTETFTLFSKGKGKKKVTLNV